MDHFDRGCVRANFRRPCYDTLHREHSNTTPLPTHRRWTRSRLFLHPFQAVTSGINLRLRQAHGSLHANPQIKPADYALCSIIRRIPLHFARSLRV